MVSDDWDNYWSSKKKNKVFRIFRTQIFARAVRYYIDTYFPKEGIFLEAGCGSGQSSLWINKYDRKFIALDISKNALEEAKKNKKFDEFILGDISNLPFSDNSLDGVWNLGVMEHFREDKLSDVLNECYRVLKKDGYFIIFWASKMAHYKILLGFYNKIFKQNLQLFPDEPTRVKSKKHAKEIMSKTKFTSVEIFFSWRDFFTDVVIVAKK